MGYIIKDGSEIKKTIAFNSHPGEIKVINNEEIEFDFQIIDAPDIDIAKDEYYYMFISESEEKYFVSEDFVPEDDKNNHFVQENFLTEEEIATFNQKTLIVADYGDGVIEYHSKPLELFDNSSEKWSTFVHKFNFKKDYFINDNKEIDKEQREMTFTVYTKIGSQKKYNISYTVLDPSEITNNDYKKVKFRLLSANLDNNGKISLMLDNIAGKKSKIILAEIKKL